MFQSFLLQATEAKAEYTDMVSKLTTRTLDILDKFNKEVEFSTGEELATLESHVSYLQTYAAKLPIATRYEAAVSAMSGVAARNNPISDAVSIASERLAVTPNPAQKRAEDSSNETQKARYLAELKRNPPQGGRKRKREVPMDPFLSSSSCDNVSVQPKKSHKSVVQLPNQAFCAVSEPPAGVGTVAMVIFGDYVSAQEFGSNVDTPESQSQSSRSVKDVESILAALKERLVYFEQHQLNGPACDAKADRRAEQKLYVLMKKREFNKETAKFLFSSNNFMEIELRKMIMKVDTAFDTYWEFSHIDVKRSPLAIDTAARCVG